jgi:hypothetical protein
MLAGSFRKSRDAPRGSPEAPLVDEFAMACAEIEFPAPLKIRESGMLKELQG